MIRLICLDMDGVLVKSNSFWMDLHREYETLEEGRELTKKYLMTDYRRLVEEVIGRLWLGKPEEPYYRLSKELELMNNLDDFFLKLDEFRDGGEKVPRAIVSGGSYETALRIQRKHGIDHVFANRLKFRDGKIAGTDDFEWPVGEGGKAKATIVNQLCDRYGILPQNVLFIGDSGIDIEAFKFVGFSIAFNTNNEELKREATYVVDSDSLLDVIPVLDEIRRLAD